jgi:hypothetical protein
MDRRTDCFDSERNQWVVVVVERVAKRRREQDRSWRPALVMVVDDRRIPLAIQHPIHVLALGLRHHVEVAVVIVPDVPLIEAR